ncbi:MAG: endopeptidase La [Lachnospiraceae bacterium]|nr:endopeptidase La [Lachnospiraceae bacterium]
MKTIPFFDIVMVTGVTYVFPNNFFPELHDWQPQVGEKMAFLMMKRQKDRKELTLGDLYPVGTIGVVKGIDDTTGSVTVTMEKRVITDTIEILEDGEIEFTCSDYPDIVDETEEETENRLKVLKQRLVSFVQQFQWGIVAKNYIRSWKTIEQIVVALSNYMDLSVEERYAILETPSVAKRHTLMEQAIISMIEISKVKDEVSDKQEEEHKQQMREMAIKKQMQILQKELDEMHPETINDTRRFELKIEESGMNEEAKKEALKVLNRMKQEGENGHEYGMLYDYLEFVTSLSWKKEEMPPVDLAKAEKILDDDHYGLKKVKERIIQQLAVMALNQKQSGSILLFAGAPGTGKTSIGKSIADALGRSYARVSLGGIRDEAEIRGHRRTYIGAMPGRIMEGIRRSGTSNPVIVLDEVDKLVFDHGGDPASALLEVLDPEQNNTFTDHYMNVPYDLSDVLFICTANYVDDIPEPLYNRMEVIDFQGYTESEKVQIAKRHLLPKAMEQCGLKKGQLKVSDKVMHMIISGYTAEAGVRGLKKQLDAICRKTAVQLLKNDGKAVSVGVKNLTAFLDEPPIRPDVATKKKNPGVVTGLAWTQAGGAILFIESLLLPGEGKITVTGQLGDVMKESVQIAISMVKSMFPKETEQLKEHDLHVHIPEGAVPKDGPSAGITMTTALASLFTGKAVSPEFAMTGEISLQGNVMPIGGLPEKLMAAVRSGVKTVLIPKDNEKNLKDVADEVKDQLKIVPVETVEEVLKITGILE